MAFEQKIWVNESADGTVPSGSPSMSAEELNRIEQGIADSLQKDGGTMTGELILSGDPTDKLQAATKQYVDNNILHFKGTATVVYDDDTVVAKQGFALPENINPSKYFGLIFKEFPNSSSVTTLGTGTTLLFWDTASTLEKQIPGYHMSAMLSSSEKTLSFAAYVSGGGYTTFNFDLFLIPVSECITLT